MKVSRRKAFTLIEVLIASAIGMAVIGSAMMIYYQGNRAFQTTTEHASLRESAQLILEKIERDLDQLIVSNEQWPSTGNGGSNNYIMVEPFHLIDIYQQTVLDPTTKQPIPYASAGTGFEFFRYDHTETGPDGHPKIIGKRVVYETKPIDPADPKKGVNLLRNGQPVNQTTLSEVIFQKVPPTVSSGEIGASPNAILKVTVIPEGGMWRTMTKDSVDKLKEQGTVLTRVFHLSGFESQYTANLFVGLTTMKKNGGNPDAIPDPVVRAVTKDALDNGGAPPDSLAKLKGNIDSGAVPAQGYQLDPGIVHNDAALQDEKDNIINTDPKFALAEQNFVKPDPNGDSGVPETLAPNDKSPFQNPTFSGGQPNHCPAVPSH